MASIRRETKRSLCSDTRSMSRSLRKGQRTPGLHQVAIRTCSNTKDSSSGLRCENDELKVAALADVEAIRREGLTRHLEGGGSVLEAGGSGRKADEGRRRSTDGVMMVMEEEKREAESLSIFPSRRREEVEVHGKRRAHVCM